MTEQNKTDFLVQLTEEIIKHISNIDETGAHTANIEEFINFRTSLNIESDRGAVLMAAAFIEDKLTYLFKAYFIDNEIVSKSFLQNNGALATFSSKIDLAYLLGLIPKNVHQDLHILRKIRNDFAHNASNINFESPHIKDRTKALSVLSQEMLRDNTRAYFLRSMTTILTVIDSSMNDFERCAEQDDFDIAVYDEAFKSIEDELKRSEES
jgi:DNA-binding MltR family transcriptional regulator